MSATNIQSDWESLDLEDIEPKLKYIRIANDLKDILSKDVVTCIAIHPKFICVGTHWGMLHLLDHKGHKVETSKLRAHSVIVNQIAVDLNGEFIATCSDDGNVFISSLCSSDSNNSINTGRVVKCVAIDPNFVKCYRFITGDERLTLHERSFLSRLKSTILCESEGVVRNISWNTNGQFVAWASSFGIRVYDLNSRCSLGLIKWENHNSLTIDNFRCNLRWADQKTLLIGWVDTVRICVIRKRNMSDMKNRDQSEYEVDPISTFRTEFYICGIAPLEDQLVLLGLNKGKDEQNKSPRPQLYIVEYSDHDYHEIYTDFLTLRGFEEYNCVDYYLDVLIEENRFFIVSPKDIIVASPYDTDDRIKWLLAHRKYEDAMDVFVQKSGKNIKNYDIVKIGKLHIDYLLANKEFDKAGELCLKICGNSKKLWEEEIYKFANLHQLRSVSPYIPCDPKSSLVPYIYEMVLYEFLRLDLDGFLRVVKEWDPKLYNACAVINAVMERLLVCNANDADRNRLKEALALLFSYNHEYDKSLSLYIELNHLHVFTFIQKYKLYDTVPKYIVALIKLDSEEAIALFLGDNGVPAHIVVSKLRNTDSEYLYKYLHAYTKNDTKGVYDSELVRLYANFDPDKLLPFLKSRDGYDIQEAFEICQKRHYYPEMVYLSARIGNTKEAIEIIITKMEDLNRAISFCLNQNDDELWLEVINYSLSQPKFITFLLKRIGSYVDPRMLVERIKNDLEISDLKQSLVTMLCDYNLQVAVQEGCNKILMKDYFDLYEKLVRAQQKGLYISDTSLCNCCTKNIVAKNIKQDSIVVYNCRHTFHEECLLALQLQNLENCVICNDVEKSLL